MRFLTIGGVKFWVLIAILILAASAAQAGNFRNPQVLIEAEQLQAYIDSGRLNCEGCWNELILAVRYGYGVPVDMRGDKAAAGSTPGVFSDVPGDYVVFEGRLKGGKSFVWKNFNQEYDNGDFQFKPTAQIASELVAAGIDGSEVVYSYCRTGYIGSVGYFVLDGILGWEVKTYDESWSQWGKMSDMTALGGELPAGSLWATDNYDLMEEINYNAAAGLPIETLQFDEAAHEQHPDPASFFANQVEIEDALYLWGLN